MVFYISSLKKKSVPITFTSPSLTKQCFKDESDINFIVKKFGLHHSVNKDGSINTSNIPEEYFTSLSSSGVSDVSAYSSLLDGKSYQDVLNAIASVSTSFEYLPSAIRSRFKNDPSLFLDYVKNPDNIPEMTKLGLIKTPISSSSSKNSPSDSPSDDGKSNA